MGETIHRSAVVGPGGHIEIDAPELQPGQRVSVVIETASEAEGPHIIDLISDLPGHRLFQNADEVDDHLRRERESWED
jgi:hypothetical protein